MDPALPFSPPLSLVQVAVLGDAAADVTEDLKWDLTEEPWEGALDAVEELFGLDDGADKSGPEFFDRVKSIVAKLTGSKIEQGEEKHQQQQKHEQEGEDKAPRLPPLAATAEAEEDKQEPETEGRTQVVEETNELDEVSSAPTAAAASGSSSDGGDEREAHAPESSSAAVQKEELASSVLHQESGHTPGLSNTTSQPLSIGVVLGAVVLALVVAVAGLVRHGGMNTAGDERGPKGCKYGALATEADGGDADGDGDEDVLVSEPLMKHEV